jgi:hypothetical protein
MKKYYNNWDEYIKDVREMTTKGYKLIHSNSNRSITKKIKAKYCYVASFKKAGVI